MKNIEYIDLSEQLIPIIHKSLNSYGHENHLKYSKEANKIWQFSLDGHGIDIDMEVVEYGNHHTCKAEIRLAQGGNKLWQFSTSVMLCSQGYGVPLSVFERRGFRTKEDAFKAGILDLESYLNNIIQKDNPNLDIKSALKLLKELEASKYEHQQMTLF